MPMGFHTAMSELNRDLYCLGCGYNLRGLSGDPLRCPECGMFNALADLEVPAAMIRRAVRRLETGPAFCTGAVVMWLCLVPVLLAGLAGFRGTAPPPKEILIFLMIVIAFAAAGWIVGVIMFRSSCGEKPGWGIALAKFHLYGAGVAAFFFAAIASGLFALIRLLFFSCCFATI